MCVTFDRQVTESLKPKEDMIAQLHWYRVFELGLLGVETLLVWHLGFLLWVCVFLLWEERPFNIFNVFGSGKKNRGPVASTFSKNKKTKVLVRVCPPFFSLCVCVCRVYDLAKLSCRKASFFEDTKKRLTRAQGDVICQWFFL